MMTATVAAMFLQISPEHMQYLLEKKTFNIAEHNGQLVVDPNQINDYKLKQFQRQQKLDSYNPPELRTDTTRTIETPAVSQTSPPINP